MALSDEQLMERVKADDLAALGCLFDRHLPPLHAFLCRILGNPSEAEDLAQETFWKAWNHRAAYDPSRAFKTWLYSIARHAAFDELKKPGHHNLSYDPSSDAPSPTSESARHPVGIAEATALRLQVRSALLDLPHDQRVAVVLREYDGYTYAEISEVLHCSEGNARILAHRGRLKLREILAPSGDGEEDKANR
jgi:RNA polymerase sigma-70 factor (ECF subfamily)